MIKTNKDEIIKGLRCETCNKERQFGSPPNTDPDNLYIYFDLSGAVRCFCIEHMSFFTEHGGMVDHTEPNTKVGYGAELISDILNENQE